MLEILIDGPIGTEEGEFSSRELRDALQSPEAQDGVTLRIHSEGGSVAEGLRMVDLIKAHPAQVDAVIESVALSIASVVAAACDHVSATENAFTMMHDPHMGDDEATDSDEIMLNKLASRMAGIYSEKTGLGDEEISDFMARESWFDANESVELGLVDEIIGTNREASQRMKHTMGYNSALRLAVATAQNRAAQPKAPKITWPQAVKALQAKGLSLSKAVAQLEDESPELRQEFIEEANKRKEEPKPRTDAKRAFEDAIQQKVDEGLKHSDAVAWVQRHQPELGRAYAREATDAAQARSKRR